MSHPNDREQKREKAMKDMSVQDQKAQYLKVLGKSVAAKKPLDEIKKADAETVTRFLAELRTVQDITGETEVSLGTIEGIVNRLSIGEALPKKSRLFGGALKLIADAGEIVGFNTSDLLEKGEESSETAKVLNFARVLKKNLQAKADLTAFLQIHPGIQVTVKGLLDRETKEVLRVAKSFSEASPAQKEAVMKGVLVNMIKAARTGKNPSKANKEEAPNQGNQTLIDALGDLLGD